ncbi:MAG: hypothetical protein ACM3X6_13425 [Patescibacteria group bacterium]
MRRRIITSCIVSTCLAAAPAAIRTAGPGETWLAHIPPSQVYQDRAFTLAVRPLVPLRRVEAYLDLAGVSMVRDMHRDGGCFNLEIPGCATKHLRGKVRYAFAATAMDGKVRTAGNPRGGPYETRLVPQPDADLIEPDGCLAAAGTFVVTIALNEAFAALPAESFQVHMDGSASRRDLQLSPGRLGFKAGPGLRDGPHTLSLATDALPGWGRFVRTWTIEVQTRETSADEGGSEAGNPFADWFSGIGLCWESAFVSLRAGNISPGLSPLTAAAYPILGAAAVLEPGWIEIRAVLGLWDEEGCEPGPRYVAGASLGLGPLSLNLAAVLDQPPAGPSLASVYRQSYVAGLGVSLGDPAAGEASVEAELAYALSFGTPWYGPIDWPLVEQQAVLPEAPESLKLLALLEPLLRCFPLPRVDLNRPETLPRLGLGWRLRAGAPLGSAYIGLDYGRLERDFVSLGSYLPQGTSIVLIVALDPRRPDTEPFSYAWGPAGEEPEGAAATHGLHLTGLGAAWPGNPFRLGFDYFRTEWEPDPLRPERRFAETARLLLSCHAALDLDLALELRRLTDLPGQETFFYLLEGAVARKFGRITLALSANALWPSDPAADPSLGLSLDLGYDDGRGLLLYLRLVYEDLYGVDAARPLDLALQGGLSLGF